MRVFDKYINKEIHNKLSKQDRYNKAVFLDRDGVLIKDCHYIKDPMQVELEKNVLEFIKLAKNFNYILIIVTNQSGISRGFLNWEDYINVNQRMIELCGSSNPFAGIYANSLIKNDSKYKFRKPNPGMILAAAKDFNINLKKSFIIGDRLSDIEAGARAGLREGIHVKTGHGVEELPSIEKHINKGIFCKEKNQKIKITLINNLKDFPKKILI